MRFYIPHIIFILLLFGELAQGQTDPQFTQFYSNPLYQAPSFAGAVEGYRVSLNYRDQWPQLPGKLTTASLAVDYNLSALNSGLGVIVMNDRVGSASYSNLNLGFVYSYNVKINRKTFFRPGLGFYYTQRSLDWQKLVFGSQLETGGTSPVQAAEFKNVKAFDGSISAILISHNIWVGLTGDHLTMPNVSFTDVSNRLPIKYTLFGGYRFHKVERLISTKRQSVTFSGTYRHQGYSDQLDLGLYWSYDPILFGLWYRDIPLIKDYTRRDAIAVLVGYKFQGLSVGYSYDFTVSPLITNTGGAHEISIVYKFELEQKKKFKAIPCPTF